MKSEKARWFWVLYWSAYFMYCVANIPDDPMYYGLFSILGAFFIMFELMVPSRKD